jgi:hypothetical protein
MRQNKPSISLRMPITTKSTSTMGFNDRQITAADAALIDRMLRRDGHINVVCLGLSEITLPRLRAALVELRLHGNTRPYLEHGHVLPWIH